MNTTFFSIIHGNENLTDVDVLTEMFEHAEIPYDFSNIFLDKMLEVLEFLNITFPINLPASYTVNVMSHLISCVSHGKQIDEDVVGSSISLETLYNLIDPFDLEYLILLPCWYRLLHAAKSV